MRYILKNIKNRKKAIQVKQSDFSTLPSWSAEYVVAHAKWRQSRGKRPSMAYRGVRDPIKALALATTMFQDSEFLDVVVTNVSESSLIRSDGWSFFIHEDWGFKPEVGDIARFYGKGIGYTVRGLDINGKECYYRNKQQQKDEEIRQHEEYIAQKKAEFEKGKPLLDKKYSKLPKVFQQRIDRFRANNPDFRWEYESYEMFCCEQAIIIAKTVKTRLKNAASKKGLTVSQFNKLRPGTKELILNKLHDMSYEKQLKAIVGLDDGHSGNTFGCSMVLASLYLSNSPSNVVKLHGALSPLVGSEKYGDIPPPEPVVTMDEVAALLLLI